MLIVLAQSALIAALLMLRHRRRQAERARLQAVEQAQRARDELAHTLRVTTLGGLVAAIAHEISQPLTAIVTNAEATRRIVSRGPTPDEVTAALTDIKADAVRASQVIQRLRALSRKVRGESREIDLERLIDETVSILRADLALKRITILTSPAKDPLPLVSGDPHPDAAGPAQRARQRQRRHRRRGGRPTGDRHRDDGDRVAGLRVRVRAGHRDRHRGGAAGADLPPLRDEQA